MASAEDRFIEMLENAKDREHFVEIALRIFRDFLESEQNDTTAKVS